MQIAVLENGPFMVNTFLVINEDTKEGFILDPGIDIDPLIQKIEIEKVNIVAIVATHGHIDHIGGVEKAKQKFNVPFYASELDKQLIDTAPIQAQMFGVPSPGKITIDSILPTSGEIEIAGLTLTLLYTPGHSKGSVSIKIDNTVFVGDTLFNASIGRTDLPGGDYEELIYSVRDQLFVLPDETRVLPGHGPETTIGREKSTNPFFNN
ncbi:MAG: MBL fold metallo-hydrolase [bacterium]|nr:MBL fold metallo-hydrolase [bacterium]